MRVLMIHQKFIYLIIIFYVVFVQSQNYGTQNPSPVAKKRTANKRQEPAKRTRIASVNGPTRKDDRIVLIPNKTGGTATISLASKNGGSNQDRYTLTATAGQLITISERYLPVFQDTELDPSQVEYHVSLPLAQEDGHLLLMYAPDMEVHEFTHSDVRRMDLVYVPPPPHLVPQERTVTFKFRVVVPKNDIRPPDPSIEETFSILLLPLGHREPKFRVSNPVIAVGQNPMANISRKYFEVEGFADDSSNVQYMLTEGPSYGSLLLLYMDGSSREMPLEEDVSASELSKAVTVQYQRSEDSLGDDIVQDTFEVLATDLQAEAVSVITLSFADQYSRAAEPPSSREEVVTIQVNEGERVALTSDYFSYALSGGGGRSTVSYTLLDSPHYGALTLQGPGFMPRDLVRGNTFSQDDANKERLFYRAVAEIGLNEVTERIPLSIKDLSGGRYRPQLLDITISPTDNQAPVVLVNGELVVREGDTEILPEDLLTVMDPDSPQNVLQLVLDAAPSFGYLATADSGGGPVARFSLSSLRAGEVRYVQNVHRGAEPPRDALMLHATDGRNRSPTLRLNVSIELVNDEAPVIVTDTVNVESSDGVIIRNSSLYVGDFDTPPRQLVLTVLQEPKHGEIRRRDSPELPIATSQTLVTGSMFAYIDVLHELIVFIPSLELQEDTMDSAVFSVTDGDFTNQASLGLHIIATPRDDPSTPILASETVQLSVSAGGMRELSSAELGTQAFGSGRHLTLISSPSRSIQLQVRRRNELGWSALQPGQPFTYDDVLQGGVRLVHMGATRSTFPVRLRIEERNGEHVSDLVLMVVVRDNVAPPSIEVNNLLVVVRNSSAIITSQHLSASDLDTPSSDLVFTIVSRPKWGHLELKGMRKSVTSWTQGDLEEDHLSYTHHGPMEATRDGFQFTLSDGGTSVSGTFHIEAKSKVAISELPMVSEIRPITVTSGSRAPLTLLELQVDSSRPEYLSLNVAVAPKLGSIYLQVRDSYVVTSSFSLLDVAEGRVTYVHEAAPGKDDYDEILLVLSCRGRPCEYVTLNEASPSHAPITLPIHIRLSENGIPSIGTNSGIPYLQHSNGKAIGFLSKNLLKATDDATSPRRIVFTVSQPPSHGLLYKSDAPATPISVFTQDDVDSGKIFYQLDNGHDYSITQDYFKFEVTGLKSKTLSENNFYIQWFWVSIDQASYTMYETDGILRVKLRRKGGVAPHSSTVRCRLVPSGGTSKATWGADKAANNDIELQYGLVQFDSYEKEKYCTIKINNDNKFEGQEDFIVEIYEPSRTLLGLTTRTHIILLDPEDQPTITFKSNLLYVNETDGPITITVYRTGDLRDLSTVRCSTQAGSARGSDSMGISHADYIARLPDDASSDISFSRDQESAQCVVQLIDDAIFEDTEDFFIILSNPDSKSILGTTTRLRVLIEGPNDVSQVYFSEGDHYILENAGEVDVAVTRTGTDLSHNSSVWCTTQAISAVPKTNYIPMSQQIIFGRGDVEAWCRLSILDDTAVPILEGPLSLWLILTSPEGATLVDPSHTTVVIDDTPLDTPTMEFAHAVLTVRENEGTLRAPVIRSGDLRYVASVKCYSRQRSARVGEDFEDRVKTEVSRITFASGQALNYCEVDIIDDNVLEGEEDFVLRLSEPIFKELNTSQEKLALLGMKAMMRVKITDEEDTPRIYFEKREITVNESSSELHTLNIKVLRNGDLSSVAKVHVMSRDGSAVSGSDYVAISSYLTFDPHVESLDITVTVLPGEEGEEGRREESFFLVLDGAAGEPGDNATLVITIRSSAAGALVLPAQPVVVSLMYYDNSSQAEENPDPGYPLVCISPCEDRYPQHARTKDLCGALKYKRIQYFWEIAVPSGLQTIRHMPFKKLTTSTFFAKIDNKVLDSIYFTTNFLVRCGVQPIKLNGRLGIPIKSPVITIGKSKNICKKTYVDNVRDQAFSASVQYINETSEIHPNTVHIKLEVPHSDGMVPLVSTHPLHNVRSLLTDALYSAHHACSNLLADRGFLAAQPTPSRSLRPHERDPTLRGIEAVRLYRHLSLRTCLWRFDAWFHMSQLVDDCHGKVLSEYKLEEGGAGELSVEVPLHVAYVAASGAQEWAAVEHRTTLHVNVRYSALLWHPGLLTEPKRGAATLQVSRVTANEAGQLVIEFWTDALFRGRFTAWHPSAPRLQSTLLPPRGLPGLGMSLDLIWSEPTWDGPRQLWRAVSNASLTDFSGQYSAMLVPCIAAPTTVYTDVEPPHCHAHPPSRIPINVAFQVPTRPEPAKYSLHTQFELTNNPNNFLADPADKQQFKNGDTPWRFSTGEKVLGRVSWNPGQDLSNAYRLQIERVLLCAGREGTTESLEAQRLGCLQPSPALAHRFVLLDRERPDTEDKEIRGVSFQARFARDVAEFRPKLDSLPGVDGFVWLVDALYQLGSGQQWFLQVLYRIRATSASERRHKRDEDEVDVWHRGTAMRSLILVDPVSEAAWHQTLLTPPVLAALTAPLLLVSIALLTWRLHRRCRTSYSPTSATAACS